MTPPSLAAADASMSPVTAAHVTQTAADEVFLGDRLSPVTEAVAIARKAKRLMRENLCLAIVYNIIATMIILKVISFIVPLRMDEATLKVGDDAVHGETAYAIGTEGE